MSKQNIETERVIVGFKTLKWFCSECKAHHATIPIMNGLEDFALCQKCGNTSFGWKKGRNIGRV